MKIADFARFLLPIYRQIMQQTLFDLYHQFAGIA